MTKQSHKLELILVITRQAIQSWHFRLRARPIIRCRCKLDMIRRGRWIPLNSPWYCGGRKGAWTTQGRAGKSSGPGPRRLQTMIRRRWRQHCPRWFETLGDQVCCNLRAFSEIGSTKIDGADALYDSSGQELHLVRLGFRQPTASCRQRFAAPLIVALQSL